MKTVFSRLCDCVEFPKTSESSEKFCPANGCCCCFDTDLGWRFKEAVPAVSAEEAIVRVVEMTETIRELARSGEPVTDLFKVLTSCPSSKYPRLYSTGWREWVG